MHERRRLPAQKLNREPNAKEVYLDSHCASGKWVDAKSEHKMAEYERELAKREGQDPDVVWVKQNLNKKGRVYGVGDYAPILKKKVEAISNSQPSDPPDVREKVTKLCEGVSAIGEMTRTLFKVCKRHDSLLADNVRDGKLKGTLSKKGKRAQKKLTVDDFMQTQFASGSRSNKDAEHDKEDDDNGDEDAT